MRLLHISDIHFMAPVCLRPENDPERPYRTRLLQDVRERCLASGTIDAIVVGGDIAYKGVAEEYGVAATWLRELAVACGCSEERIYTVPGNHDVDRTKLRQGSAALNAQRSIVRCRNEEREQELRVQLENSGEALLFPLSAYNDFAAPFDCQVYPGRIAWQHELDLGQGVKLRIHGLTSTLVSGGDDHDRPRGLYLGPFQTALNPDDDVVNLVLCHHPVDWFIDFHAVEDAINGRAPIQLFGHAHRQRVLAATEFIRFSAAAVNPDRNEAGWEPGYNIIKLSVSGDGQERKLDVEAQVLTWQTNPELFREKRASQADPYYRARFSIPHYRGPLPAAAAPVLSVSKSLPQPDASAAAAGNETLGSAHGPGEIAMDEEATRRIVLRFWRLSSSQRREIALALGLLEENDAKVSEPQRYRRVLLRAGERKKLQELSKLIEEKERKK